MLMASFALLLAAAMIGLVLATIHLAAGRAVPIPWPAWGLHGVLGAAGFVALLASLGGPPRGEALGVAGFGDFAAVLLGTALLVGGAILASRLRHARMSILTIGLHATLAIGGVVVLAAFTLIG